MKFQNRLWLGLGLILTLGTTDSPGSGLAGGESEEPRLILTTPETLPVRGGLLPIDVELAAAGSGGAGLGVAVGWDGGRLEFLGFDHVFEPALVGKSLEPEEDLRNLDSDPRTDRLVRLAWAEAGGRWAGAREGTRLARILFRVLDTDRGREATSITAVSLSQAPGYRFATVRQPLSISAARSEGERRRISAAGRPGAAAEVRRHPGVRYLASSTEYLRPPTVGLQASTESPSLCSLDVDADGRTDALTDGLLVLRHLFGFGNENLVTGTLGTAAARETADEIAEFLANRPCVEMLDVDGNGSIDALTDGLLTLRYLFGFSGDSLAGGAVAPGAPRAAGAAIESWLALYLSLYAAIELSPPDLPAPLVAEAPVNARVPTRYTGTLILQYALAEGPAGMTVDSVGGVLRWTPQVQDEGSEVPVRVTATDGEASAEVAFTLRVAPATPLQTEIDGRTVRVTSPGSLQGFSITLPDGSASSLEGIRLQTTSPADVEIAEVAPEWAATVPSWITPLSSFFRVAGWERGADPARLRFPLYALPQGRFLDEVRLFIYLDVDHGLTRPGWISTQQNLELTADGEVTIDLWSAPGLCFIGLPGDPGGAGSTAVRDVRRAASTSPADAGVTCEPREIRLGGVTFYRYGDTSWVCQVAGSGLTVRVEGWQREAIRWRGEVPDLETVVGWLGDAYQRLTSKGMSADRNFEVRFEPMECADGSCLNGFVSSVEDLRTLHLASTWWEGGIGTGLERPEVFAVQNMSGTAAHEYFHHAQGRTRLPLTENILGPSILEREWIAEGSAVWFEDEVFDHKDTYSTRGPAPRILEAGLAAFHGSLGTPSDGYSRFPFWKMVLTQANLNCLQVSLPQLFNFTPGAEPKIPTHTMLAQLKDRLASWGCNFGPWFGAGSEDKLESALLRYQVGTQYLGSMAFLDPDETIKGFFVNADRFSPGSRRSAQDLGGERVMAPAGARSFVLNRSNATYTLRIEPSSDGPLLVSVLTRDPSLSPEEGWSPLVTYFLGEDESGTIQADHTWAELTEARRLRIERHEGTGTTPLLFVTVVNPSHQNYHSYRIQVSPSPDPFVLAGGQWHSHYVKPDGGVLGWGWNGWWQLGTGGSNDDRLTPVAIPNLAGTAAVAGGRITSFAILGTGRTRSWGTSNYGQLANGQLWDSEPTCSTINCARTPSPTLLTGDIKAIATKRDHALALHFDGTVSSWGERGFRALGNRSYTGCTTFANGGCQEPGKIPSLFNIVSISAGPGHSLAADESGRVWAWGWNESSQLGYVGDARFLPRQVTGFPEGTKIIQVAGGGNGINVIQPPPIESFSAALAEDGTVWTWGNNAHGQLGHGNTTAQVLPTRVAGLEGVVAISAGIAHMLALTDDGILWAWGDNTYGQVGNNSQSVSVTSPVPVLVEVDAFAAGGQHSLARTTDRAVWAWGFNAYGQVGDGTRTNRRAPVEVIAPPAP